MSYKDALDRNWVANKSRKYVPEVLMALPLTYNVSLLITRPLDIFYVPGEVCSRVVGTLGGNGTPYCYWGANNSRKYVPELPCAAPFVYHASLFVSEHFNAICAVLRLVWDV